MAKTPAKTHGEDYERFGHNLAALRNSRGLSQAELADKLGLLQSTYAPYETGTRKVPLSVLIKLSNFFNVPLDDLIGTSNSSNTSNHDLKESERNLLASYRKLNYIGKQKLSERIDELIYLGYVEQYTDSLE